MVSSGVSLKIMQAIMLSILLRVCECRSTFSSMIIWEYFVYPRLFKSSPIVLWILLNSKQVSRQYLPDIAWAACWSLYCQLIAVGSVGSNSITYSFSFPANRDTPRSIVRNCHSLCTWNWYPEYAGISYIGIPLWGMEI